ncbi:3-methyl-2-oxobutanoate hydroxymethyltransferase [Rothia amarae]|uniref:3-methyl-2-oxobutanoate hydroxymethyltransferase n=1 Tax=Rothia amarae TaxID=169480 RepID=A0A7H2BHP0_9MICC|nr:3-methyl-2-oxobutanoate hydroxymethyltransferase [Rothia amarae]QNV39186.1 3-methyl-2-oxobutanoate hydroxymethyltransferase [Rothia amarae]
MTSSDDSLGAGSEETAPYSESSPDPVTPAEHPEKQSASVFDGVRKIRTVHLAAAKKQGEKFAMLTSYDYLTAQIFDSAGIEILLVGDSAGSNVLGHESTLSITVDQMIPLVGAVAAGAQRALVVADLPFGSYQQSPEQAVATAVRMMKEGGAHAVKMEVNDYFVDHVRAVAQAGIPVMAHIGFTPQSEHALGGYRVQGRGETGAKVVETARLMEEAGAFCILMEMLRSDVAAEVERIVEIPTIGIGAGGATTGQVLVWQDMFGLRQGKMARFVKQYANLFDTIQDGARAYRADVRSGAYPAAEHRFDD